MRILIDGRSVRSPISGSAQYAINLSNNISNLLAPSDCLHVVTSNFLGRNSQCISHLDKSVILRNPVTQVLPRQVLTAFLDLFNTNPLLYNSNSYDIIHETYLGSLPTSSTAAKVSTLLDLIPFDRPELFPRRTRFIFNTVLKRQIETSQVIFISISNYTKNRFLAYSGVEPDRVSVIPCGIRELKGDHSPTDIPFDLHNTAYLLYVGNIEPRKNLSTLAKALASINHLLPIDLKLVVAGKPCWDYQSQIDTLNKLVGNRIVFLGFVSEVTKWNLLRNAKCLIYPSEYEGFGIPIIEAMRAKTPVLFSDNSSMSELAVCSNQLFETYDYDSLGNKILQILDDDSWVSESVVRSYQTSLRYSWDFVAKETIAIYKKLINS